MAKRTVGFSYDDEVDADIARWLSELDDRQANKSAAIRAAIRAYIGPSAITLGDVLNELGDIKQMIRGGVVAVQSNGEAGAMLGDEPDPETLAAQQALNVLCGGLG